MQQYSFFRLFYKLEIHFLIFTLIFFTFSCKTLADNEKSVKGEYVVIVSMDGFRHDYDDRFNTPNLDLIAQKGVYSDSLIPVFPSMTFPNHYSMATGLYPDNHGIVANNFYCPDIDKTFRIRDREAIENGDFYFGEPIWITAENQNVTTATYFWVGTEASINNVQPSYWKKYDYTDPFESRIDTVVYWLNLPEDVRPRLVMLYFNEPDNSGHRLGPEGEDIRETIEYMDSLVGVLHEKLKELPIYDKINLIITSDHGMSQNSADRHINLSEYIDRDWLVKRHGGGPVHIIEPKPEFSDSIYNILSGVENLSIWKNEDLPERFYYGKNPRTLQMTILADSSWSIGFSRFNERYIGSHGYDNLNRDMQTVFYAIGPDFKYNYRHGAFMVTDFYPMLAYLLRLQPANTDGSFNRIKKMLVE